MQRAASAHDQRPANASGKGIHLFGGLKRTSAYEVSFLAHPRAAYNNLVLILYMQYITAADELSFYLFIVAFLFTSTLPLV